MEMGNLKLFFKIVDSLSEWCGKFSALFILPGAAVLLLEVILRYGFNHPTMWAHGISQRLFATYYILGGAYVLLYRDHVNVDIIYNKFSLRVKAIINLITSPCFFAFCVVLLWHGLGFAMTSISQLEPDETPWRAPIYPVKAMLPVGALLILLQGLANFSRDLVTAITGRKCEY